MEEDNIREKNPYEEILEAEERLENHSTLVAEQEHHVKVKDHLDKDVEDECAYCGQTFVPDEIVIEKILNARKWKFCSEECYRDFLERYNFKDVENDDDEKKDSATFNVKDDDDVN